MARALVVKLLLVDACDEDPLYTRLAQLVSSPGVRAWEVDQRHDGDLVEAIPQDPERATPDQLVEVLR